MAENKGRGGFSGSGRGERRVTEQDRHFCCGQRLLCPCNIPAPPQPRGPVGIKGHLPNVLQPTRCRTERIKNKWEQLQCKHYYWGFLSVRKVIFLQSRLLLTAGLPRCRCLFRWFKSQSHRLQRSTGDDINGGDTGSPKPKTPPAGLNLSQIPMPAFSSQEAPTWSRFIPLTRRRLAESLKREGRGAAEAFGNHVGSNRGLQNSKW